MNRKIFIRIFIFIIFFYLISFIFSQILQISINDLQQAISSLGIYAPIIYIFIYLLGLTIPFNPISEFLLINVAALIFPPFIAMVFTFLVHSLALTINYYIGRKFGKRILKVIVKEENFRYIEKYLKKLTIRNLFIIRFFIPISSLVGADIVSYISGMERLPFIKYYIASIIPWTIMSIIYFSTTSYLRDKSIFIYFLPVAIIIGIPLLLLFIINKYKKI